jgi:transcriptional regulator with XRE-family HTH domain
MARRRKPLWAKGGDVHLISSARLDLAMTEAGLNNSQLARAIGHASHSYVSRMRRGVPGAASVTPKTAEQIAKFLGVEREWLFEVRKVKSADLTMGKAAA